MSTAQQLEVIDCEWLSADEALISLQHDHEDVGAVWVRVSSEDSGHPAYGREVHVHLVDVEGSPDCESWLRAHASAVVDRYDAHQARLQGRWC